MNIQKLQKWYIKNHRKLPFRETNNPYYIWVSEIMLQQTQVVTVIPYFKRFIKKYPTVEDLAKTTENDLLHMVQGLGYYRRFKHMLKAAKLITESYGGLFPRTYKEVLSLPGVGDYTAGAIMSIAYNQPISATDGNVIRVLTRVNDIDTDMRRASNKKSVKNLNQSNIELATPHIYTQAIMELGALICKPNHPLCDECPIHDDCLAFKKNKQDQLPYLSKKPKKKQIKYLTFIIMDEEGIYIRKRREQLLGGMYEFPQFETHVPFNYKVIKDHGVYKHVFTHLVWEMKLISIQLKSKPQSDWVKVSIDDLNQYPMSTAHRKLIKYIL